MRFLRGAIRALPPAGARAAPPRAAAVAGPPARPPARAFASLADMLAWGGHLLAPDGIWLAMKGKPADDELPGIPAGFALRARHTLDVPGLDAERHLLVVARS